MQKKTLFTILCACALTLPLHAQQDSAVVASDSVPEGFVFTTVDSVGITPVKNQHRSSTC